MPEETVETPVLDLLASMTAGELEIDPEQVRGVLAAVAPIVGTARIASATSKIVRALALELEVAELEAEAEEEA